MLLNQVNIGENESKIEFTLLSSFQFAKSLFKFQLADNGNTKVNLFIANPIQIEFFRNLPIKAKLFLPHFHVTKDFSDINKHFPDVIKSKNFATQGSNYDFILRLPEILPAFSVFSKGKVLEIPENANLEEINPLEYFQSPNIPQATQQEKISRCLDLEFIHQKVKNGHFISSCCAVIIDCCDSYSPKPGENQDFLVCYKITDPSIFPEHATINIFHKDSKEIPKIANFGDVIILNDIQFGEYSNHLQGLIPANSKTMSFQLIKCNDQQFLPYSSYKTSLQLIGLTEIIIKPLID